MTIEIQCKFNHNYRFFQPRKI